jgi:hypothetical protein
MSTCRNSGSKTANAARNQSCLGSGLEGWLAEKERKERKEEEKKTKMPLGKCGRRRYFNKTRREYDRQLSTTPRLHDSTTPCTICDNEAGQK